MKNNKTFQQETFQLGKQMIESAISMDQSLADLLKAEVLRLKKLNRMDTSTDDLAKTNQLLKNIIYALTINSDKISNGIDLCRSVESVDDSSFSD